MNAINIAEETTAQAILKELEKIRKILESNRQPGSGETEDE